MARQRPLRTLVLLSLLGLLLCAIIPPQGILAGPLQQSKNDRNTLCGQLVFLVDSKTQARLIGLIPCNGNRPLIFAARPGELFEFYRLTNVTIKKGDKVQTLTHGVLETYITGFDSYQGINSCRECDSDAAILQPPSAEQAAGCSAWVLDQAAAAFPALDQNQALQTMQENLGAYAGGTVVSQACGLDRACRVGAVAQQLGVQLGPRLGWAGLPAEQVIDWLATLLADPAGTKACPAMDVFAPRLAVGLNQQGFGIDLAAASQGCDLLASDSQGRSLGFKDGQTLEQIPGARPVAASAGQYLLLPAGSASRLELACTQSETINLQWVQRDETGIRQYIFSRLSVRDKTRGEIDLFASPLVLSLDARGDGVLQPRKPDRSLLQPALVALIPPATPTGAPASPTLTPGEPPPSPTPQPSSTPTAAPTSPPPGPTAAPEATAGSTPAPQSGPTGLCPLAFGAALLPGALWLNTRRRKRFSLHRR